MKLLSVFVVLCLVACSTPSPLYDGCNDNVQLYFDDNSCVQIQCYFYNNQTFHVSRMSTHSCPFLTCRWGQQLTDIVPGDETAVFPGCCPKAVCE